MIATADINPGITDNRIATRTPNAATSPSAKERAANRAEVIHETLEAVRSTVRLRSDQIGKQSITCWDAKSTRRPRTGAKYADLPDGRRDPDQAREYHCGRVAADRDRSSPPRVIGKRTSTESRNPGERIGDAFDDAQRTGRCAECAG